MDPKNLTLVVARYNEDLEWLKTLPWRYVVFNKGDDLAEWVENEIKLPNIGREAHSYLIYITSNYDNLSKYTIFVQGNPFTHSKEIIKKITNFDGRNDFYDLADNIVMSGRYGNQTHFESKTAESAKKIFLERITDFRFGKGAQFILSKRIILSHPKIVYEKIIDLMIEGQMYNRDCSRKNCKCSNPFSAWMLERLWRTLFNNKHRTIYD